MTLNSDISKIKDRHLLHNTADKNGSGIPPFPKDSPEDREGDKQWRITQNILFVTMSVGMNSITEANAEKFYTRCLMLSAVYGKPLMQWDEEKDDHVRRDYSFAEIHRRIGLTTNASSLTDAQFAKNLINSIREKAERNARAEIKAFKEQGGC